MGNADSNIAGYDHVANHLGHDLASDCLSWYCSIEYYHDGRSSLIRDWQIVMRIQRVPAR